MSLTMQLGVPQHVKRKMPKDNRPLILALGRQRQRGVCEFEAILGILGQSWMLHKVTLYQKSKMKSVKLSNEMRDAFPVSVTHELIISSLSHSPLTV